MQEEVEKQDFDAGCQWLQIHLQAVQISITQVPCPSQGKKLQKQKSRDTLVIPHGKQTVKQLIGQKPGVSFPTLRSLTLHQYLRRSPGNMAWTAR